MNGNHQTLPASVQMQQMLMGFEVSQALYVVAELGIATVLLDGPRSVEELARATGTDEEALGRLIRFLASQGVFRRQDGKVEVTPLGETLAAGPADSVRDLARYFMETHYAPFASLLHTVRTGEVGATRHLGKPFFEWINESPRLAAIQSSAFGGAGKALFGDLLDVYRLPEGKTVADIGGSDGALLAELLARRPELRGIVFDMPNVVAGAAENLAAAGLSERTTTVGGDFFTSVPDADIYVMCAILHDWSNADSLRILRSIARAAAPGARLVLLEALMPEGDDPHFTKMMDLNMLAMVSGRERTETEWRQLLADGGFTLDRVVSGSGLRSAIEATLS